MDLDLTISVTDSLLAGFSLVTPVEQQIQEYKKP